MKKTYQTPNTQVLQVETTILCASGQSTTSGTLNTMNKSGGYEW